MQEPFVIKGITIGEGRPVICVPVVETEDEAIIAKIRDLAQRGVKMIEWRVDLFPGIAEPERVKAVLAAVKEDVAESILLFTIRTKKQGGSTELEEKKILYLNELAAKSGSVDMIDLEFFEATKPEREIRRLQKLGVRVIASHHDFHQTPDERILKMVMEQMRVGGADVVKIAMMPNSTEDVLRVIALTNDLKREYPRLPVITMSMGGLGVVSRLVGETFGSCVTFGADGKVSAPGQMQMETLEGILDSIHESITGGK